MTSFDNFSLFLLVSEKQQNLRRLQAQRNELNAKVRMLREELQLLVRSWPLTCSIPFKQLFNAKLRKSVSILLLLGFIVEPKCEILERDLNTISVFRN